MASNVTYYGACKLCDCEYMGSEDNICSCTHPSSQHILLGYCTQCDVCQGFESPSGFAQCFDCLHDSSSHGEPAGNKKYNQVKLWVAQGVKQADMIKLYESKFGKAISSRSLRRLLAEWNVSAVNKEISDEQILDAVRVENTKGVIGYQKMHKILRTGHNLLVGRDRLWNLMRGDETIPKGQDPKLARKLHQNPFTSEGPNWLWSIDGHEKLAQPFGLYIYGIIDTFSRKILSLKVLGNKKKATVAKWLIHELNAMQGIPKTIMIDKGSEWNDVVPHMPLIQMSSCFNQKIESFWSQLSKDSQIKSFKTVLRELDSEGLFNAKEETHRWALYMAFERALQTCLNEFRERWNAHTIRKQKCLRLPSGFSPDIMYENPEMFDKANYLQTKEHPIVDLETEDVRKKFALPQALYNEAMNATKDDCLQIYADICQYIN